MTSELKNCWDQFAKHSEYVGPYMLLGLKMLLKVCLDRRTFERMTGLDADEASRKFKAAQEKERKKKERQN